MLTLPLIHPPLLDVLSRAGHGSKILLADGNYPHSTGAAPHVPRVYLNLVPGLLDVDAVLAAIVTSIPIEAAAVMVPADGSDVPAHQGYRATLGKGVEWSTLGRFEFYETSRGPDLAVLVATADQRIYANLLLTVGVRMPEEPTAPASR